MVFSKKAIEKGMFCGAKSDIVDLAQRLRKNPTQAETEMWKLLRQFRVMGFPFRRQHPLEFYVADFYCHKLRLVIEVDGEIHSDAEVIDHDEGRTGELERFDIKVLRFTNNQVLHDKGMIIMKITDIIKASPNLKSPPPLPLGEGDRGGEASYILRRLLLVLAVVLFYIHTDAQNTPGDWPLFRGKADLSGKYDADLPVSPQLLWSLATGARTKSSPVVSDGTIFFGNDKGTLIAVSEGKIKWKYEDGSLFEAAPLIFGNKVIIGSNEGTLKAIDKVTGKLIWSYKTDNQISGSANVWISGSKAGIVVGSYDYYLHCVDPRTGKVLWKVETDNYVNGTPAIQDGKIIFGGCDGIVRVVDPLTGEQKDTINIGVYIASSPALSGDFAYIGDYDGNKYCVNTRSGRKTWTIPATPETGSVLAIPAVGSNKIVIGSEDKYLYCYNAADGKQLWKYRTNGRITGSAVVSKDKVLFTGMDGYVTILNFNDGKKLWSFNAGTPISTSPAVSAGKIYVLTDDGRLLAFGQQQKGPVNQDPAPKK